MRRDGRAYILESGTKRSESSTKVTCHWLAGCGRLPTVFVVRINTLLTVHLLLHATERSSCSLRE